MPKHVNVIRKEPPFGSATKIIPDTRTSFGEPARVAKERTVSHAAIEARPNDPQRRIMIVAPLSTSGVRVHPRAPRCHGQTLTLERVSEGKRRATGRFPF